MASEQFTPQIKKGHIKVYAADDPSYVLLDQDNVICDSSRILFSRMCANIDEPKYGIWGLAVGAGLASWADSSSTTPPPAPDKSNTPTSLHNLLARKQASKVRFMNADGTIAAGFTKYLEVVTPINATTDGINVPLMEMGLIGGGSASANNGAGTDMKSAAFWNPVTNLADSVILVNYTTFGSLSLPAGRTLLFSWTLSL